jgi:hypothetical protein
VTTNDTSANPRNEAIQFTGNTGINVSNVASFSALGGCSQTGGTECSNALTFQNSPTTDPLSALASAIGSLTPASFTGGQLDKKGNPTGQCPQPATPSTPPTPYGSGAAACYYSGWSPSGTVALTSGVYFFDGPVQFRSSSLTVTGTATLVLLPGGTGPNHFSGASLTINGGPTIQLTGLSSVSTTQVPPALASVVTDPPGLMNDLVIYDPETTTGTGNNKSVNFSGSSTFFLSGITYAPNADIVYQGNTNSSTCTVVIAKGITFSGNSNFDDTTCPASVKNNQTFYVRLVQ